MGINAGEWNLPYIYENHDASSVTAIFQKAKLAVTEEGAEGAAATAVVGRKSHEGSDFNAKRPFLYVITDRQTRAIYFIGTYQGDIS